MIAALAHTTLATLAPITTSENVLVVLMDGMRWQEVCGGLQTKLADSPKSGLKDATELKKTWWRDDGFLRELWTWVQSTKGYKDKTTLIVAPDRGRGDEERGDWLNHGATNPGSDEVWIAAMGPSVRVDGVATTGEVKIAQIASSIARALGLDWRATESRAMPALPAFGRNVR